MMSKSPYLIVLIFLQVFFYSGNLFCAARKPLNTRAKAFTGTDVMESLKAAMTRLNFDGERDDYHAKKNDDAIDGDDDSYRGRLDIDLSEDLASLKTLLFTCVDERFSVEQMTAMCAKLGVDSLEITVALNKSKVFINKEWNPIGELCCCVHGIHTPLTYALVEIVYEKDVGKRKTLANLIYHMQKLGAQLQVICREGKEPMLKYMQRVIEDDSIHIDIREFYLDLLPKIQTAVSLDSVYVEVPGW